jgi:hypothetical protein
VPNEPVHVTAARVRMLLNLKSLGLGGGPRRHGMDAPSESQCKGSQHLTLTEGE